MKNQQELVVPHRDLNGVVDTCGPIGEINFARSCVLGPTLAPSIRYVPMACKTNATTKEDDSNFLKTKCMHANHTFKSVTMSD